MQECSRWGAGRPPQSSDVWLRGPSQLRIRLGVCKRRLRDRLGGSVEKKQQRITQVSHFTVPRKTFYTCSLHCAQCLVSRLARIATLSGLLVLLVPPFVLLCLVLYLFQRALHWSSHVVFAGGLCSGESGTVLPPFFFSPCSVGVCRGACHRSSCGTGSPGDH